MPCQSDYMAASGQELESKRVCGLLSYIYHKADKPLPEWIAKAKDHYYGNVSRLDEATAMLCAQCRAMSPEEVEEYIYDAHSPDARRLASWWENHQEWDKRRVAEEEESRKKIMLKDRAVQKLTTEERDALGL